MTEHPPSLDGTPPEQPRWPRWRFLRHMPSMSILSALVLVVAILLYPYMVITVPSGEVGVLWKRIPTPGIYCLCILSRGTVLNPREIRGGGLHIIWPWDRLFLYNLRLHSETEKYNAISSDGVSVTAQINVRYQLNYDSVAVLHKFIGPTYFKSILSPEIGSQARNVISRFQAKDVYTSRSQIENAIKATAQNSLGSHLNQLYQAQASQQDDAEEFETRLQNSIQILDTLVLDIELPAAIVSAINSQTEQQYKIMEYRFRAEREIEESKRKQIEANGIAAFQQTVSQGISDSYLRWQGIAATLALAQSSNAKVVVIGTGKDGLPIILGNVDAPSGLVQPAKPAGGGEGTPPPAGSPGNQTTPPAPRMTPDGPPADSSKRSGAPGPTPPPPSETKSSADVSSAFELSDVRALLSRLSEILRSTGSAGSPETGTKPKG
jgi:regulator of protease activity HflC (stomatin/prohibitin superfamily)